MAKLILHCIYHDNAKLILHYDNMESTLTFANGESVPLPSIHLSDCGETPTMPAFSVNKNTPAGKAKQALKTVKIQLGLNCNYSCEYCNQRFVPHSEGTNPKSIAPFLRSLPDWLQSDFSGRFEFWGGEPLVYWRTLKPLAESLRKNYPNSKFFIITNGSLLDAGKNDWLVRLGFTVAVSHDGPGQSVRGKDPLENAETKAAILDLYRRLTPLNRFSFNTMLNRENTSRAAISRFFIELTGDATVQIGEGAFIDPYDSGGKGMSLQDEGEEISFRRQAYKEGCSGESKNVSVVISRILELLSSLQQSRKAVTLGQKCSMDRSDNIAVDLNGDVLTCQNISAVATAPNGESHKIGNVFDFANIKLKTATHWAWREDCASCPVLQTCKGSCMFLEGDLWQAGCNNAFSDHIASFAMAIEYITGAALMRIEGGRDDRVDIWERTQAAGVQRNKIIPIMPVA